MLYFYPAPHTEHKSLLPQEMLFISLFSLLPKGDQSLYKCKTYPQIILWDYTGSQPLMPQGLRQEGYMGCQSTPRKNLVELSDLPEPSGNLSVPPFVAQGSVLCYVSWLL